MYPQKRVSERQKNKSDSSVAGLYSLSSRSSWCEGEQEKMTSGRNSMSDVESTEGDAEAASASSSSSSYGKTKRVGPKTQKVSKFILATYRKFQNLVPRRTWIGQPFMYSLSRN